MSLRVSLAVLAVALISVIYGLDWQSPPQAPQHAASTAVQQPIVFPALPPPPPPVPILPESADASASEATQARAQAPKVVAPAGCNVSACEAAYRSFRASDCTYQPNNGPRRLCKKR